MLDALGIAQLIDRRGMGHPDVPAGSLDEAYLTMLDVRTELHRVSGRGRDELLAQFADEVSAALGVGDRFALARMLSGAGRTIAYHAETGLRTAQNALPRRGISALVRRPKRRPLDEGVVEYDGEIVLAREAQPENDPGLVLRVAAASADTGLPIGAATLSRLAASVPDMPTPWPQESLDDLLVVLLAGPTMVNTIEALDRTGLWGRLLPEWDAVRDLPPRDVSHKWTVDRHIVETTVNAAPLTTNVARSDLLALGALLHDIGKGRGTDHCVLGADLVIPIGKRLGLVAPGHRHAVQDGSPPPVAARHGHPKRPQRPESDRGRLRGAGQGSATARTAARAGGGGLEGHRTGSVERLESLPDRRPGASQPAGDGG